METVGCGALVRFSHLRTDFHDVGCRVIFPQGTSSMLPQTPQLSLIRQCGNAEENH
jgi:hypothetical protein